MKNFLVLALLAVIAISCKKPEPKIDGYIINGSAPGIYNGVRAYLKVKDDRGTEIIMGTAIIFDETFTFSGNAQSPNLWSLTINSVAGELPIIVENGIISVTINKDNLLESKIKGSKSNDALAAYGEATKLLNIEHTTLRREARDLRTSTNTEAINKNNLELEESNKKLAAVPFEFITNYRDNYFSLMLLENLMKDQNADLSKIETSLKSLDNELKTSVLGAKVSSILESKKQAFERLGNLNIGKVAPDFSVPDANGSMISLNNIRGKVTIIDFWAAWCGPCRRENPNVVNIYNKYHSKGLEIIGVSLDRPGQKDRWVQAIADDKLTWHNVSNLQYFNDPVAQLYNIQSIPATYILDANGVIVAKNLRGAELEAKIEELLR